MQKTTANVGKMPFPYTPWVYSKVMLFPTVCRSHDLFRGLFKSFMGCVRDKIFNVVENVLLCNTYKQYNIYCLLPNEHS